MQHKSFITRLTLLSLCSYSLVACVSTARESDWLKSRVGSEGTLLGAQVTGVQQIERNNETIIELSIPPDQKVINDNIEVISQKTLQPIPQKKTAEWIRNEETGNQELRLFFLKKPTYEFRLRLTEPEKE